MFWTSRALKAKSVIPEKGSRLHSWKIFYIISSSRKAAWSRSFLESSMCWTWCCHRGTGTDCDSESQTVSTAATSIPLGHAEKFLLKIIKVLLQVKFDPLNTLYNPFIRSVSPIAVQSIQILREKYNKLFINFKLVPFFLMIQIQHSNIRWCFRMEYIR